MTEEKSLIHICSNQWCSLLTLGSHPVHIYSARTHTIAVIAKVKLPAPTQQQKEKENIFYAFCMHLTPDIFFLLSSMCVCALFVVSHI